MNCNPKLKRGLLGHFRDILIIIIVSNLVAFMFNPEYVNIWGRIKMNSLYGLLIGVTLWKGNQYLGWFIGRKFDFNKQPYKTLRWSLISMLIYTLIAILVVNYVWYVLIYDSTVGQMFKWGYSSMIIEFIITVVITSIYYSIGFFRAWRETAVNEERLQKESIKLQFRALKNQVNPHFLFNSLNSLTSLVYQDQDQAAKFIKQLSEVYRYILEHKDNELVSLADEISFSEKYIFLQKIRHGESLRVNIHTTNETQHFVVPVSLQILIENAIKHNEVSEENPLTINVFSNGDYIHVVNNKKHKNILKESGGIGLSTIRARYSFLTDKKVITNETDDSFEVLIPLLKKG